MRRFPSTDFDFVTAYPRRFGEFPSRLCRRGEPELARLSPTEPRRSESDARRGGDDILLGSWFVAMSDQLLGLGC